MPKERLVHNIQKAQIPLVNDLTMVVMNGDPEFCQWRAEGQVSYLHIHTITEFQDMNDYLRPMTGIYVKVIQRKK